MKCILSCGVALILSCKPGLWAQTDELHSRGISLIKASRPTEAEAVFRAILVQDPQANDARIQLGFLYLQRGALAEAEAAFTRVLELEPRSSEARLGLATILFKQGLVERAVSEFQKILSDPKVGQEAQVQHLQALYILGREQEALDLALRLTAQYPLVPEYHAYLGFLRQARGKTLEARDEYLAALKLQPRNIYNYMNVIGVSGALGDWKQSAEWAERALALDPNHPLIHRALALALDRLGRATESQAEHGIAQRTLEAERLFARAAKARFSSTEGEAETLLRESVRLNPNLSKAWTSLGELLRQQGRLEEARTSLQMALDTDPGNATAYLILAELYKAQGREEESSSTYERALAHGIEAPDVLSGMAAVRLNRGQGRTAAALMLRAIQQSPDDPDLLSYLGYLEESIGDSDAALLAYAAAMRRNPGQVDAITGSGRSLLARGDVRHAIERFYAAIQVDSSNVQAWHGLIDAQRQLKDQAGAIRSARDCLKHASQDSSCLEQAASLEIETGSFGEAARHFQALLDRGITSKPILDGVAFAWMKLGQADKAIALWQKSLKSYGRDAWVYSNLGFAFRMQGKIEQAIENYRSALGQAPGDPDRHYDLALALYLARDYVSAAEHFLVSLRLRPDYGPAHYNLAMTYWNLRAYDQALSHARSARSQGYVEADFIIRSLTQPVAAAPKSASVYRLKQ